MTRVWFGGWVVLLALGWLVPNHHAPWLSFHADAWIAFAMLLAAGAVFWRSNRPIAWHTMAVLPLLMIGLLWLQYATGLVESAGVAWVYFSFLLGFLLALVVGAHWEAAIPDQLGDGLFLAVGLAAVVSVGLQLQQWLVLDGLWLLNLRASVMRPSANLGQPNQLATLLLWGVLAAAWGVARKSICGWVAVLLAGYLLFGVALTGSRTAWLAVILLMGATWLWRHQWKNKKTPWVVTGLGIYFAACVAGLAWFSHMANVDTGLTASVESVVRMSGETRPRAWALLADAALQKPWLGYGLGQTVFAQMAVATEHAHLPHVFSYAHNLLLDLLVWFGIPLGMLIFVGLLVWLLRRMRAVQDDQDAVLVMFLLVIGNHALLELPLYFGYFLLPVGLVMGMLNTRLKAAILFCIPRSMMLIAWLLASILLSLIVRDYVRVESSYRVLSMAWSGIETSETSTAPEVLLLTQWRDYIRVARLEPQPGLTEADLTSMRYTLVVYPNLLMFYKLATSLAFNHQPAAANAWLQRMCTVTSQETCQRLQKASAKQVIQYPEITTVVSPSQQTN